MSHVTDQDLRKLVAGTLDPASRRQLFAHLLSGCPGCRAKTDPLARLLVGKDNAPPTSLPAPAESAYESVLDRVLGEARRLEEHARREHATRDRFLAAIERPLRLSAEEILDRIEAEGLSPRAGVEVLLTLSHEERARNPQRMLDLALAARITADNLPCSEHAAPTLPPRPPTFRHGAGGSSRMHTGETTVFPRLSRLSSGRRPRAPRARAI
jgi:hypothetical protein